MNELFATWHTARPGVLEQLSQARRQLAGEPGLEGAWVLVDNAIAQVSLWLEQQSGRSPATLAGPRPDVHRLLQPVPQQPLEGHAQVRQSGAGAIT